MRTTVKTARLSVPALNPAKIAGVVALALGMTLAWGVFSGTAFAFTFSARDCPSASRVASVEHGSSWVRDVAQVQGHYLHCGYANNHGNDLTRSVDLMVRRVASKRTATIDGEDIYNGSSVLVNPELQYVVSFSWKNGLMFWIVASPNFTVNQAEDAGSVSAIRNNELHYDLQAYSLMKMIEPGAVQLSWTPTSAS